MQAEVHRLSGHRELKDTSVRSAQDNESCRKKSGPARGLWFMVKTLSFPLENQ